MLQDVRATVSPSLTISKTATRTGRCRRRIVQFRSARAAFKAILRATGLQPNDRVLLPAYIGCNTREGSGVMDPIRELGLTANFYQITPQLRIDLEDLRRCIRTSSARLLLLVHYFGFPDPDFGLACELAREYGLIVVEDEAHSMFSDWVGGTCGRLGDFSIMSLNKLLPVPSGGLLIINDENCNDFLLQDENRVPLNAVVPFWEYDTFSIAQERRQNAESILEFLNATPEVQALIPLTPGVVPQTVPILVNEGCRDRLYTQLNAEGYGVVTLYHTLISEVSAADYPAAHWLSKRILNLPVHQDADQDVLRKMVTRLASLLREWSRPVADVAIV